MPIDSRGHEDVELRPLERGDDRLGDVLRLQHLDRPRLRQAGAELGVDDRRHHAGDLDVRVAKLGADRLGDADDEVLGAAIGGAAGKAGLAGLRGEVDDVAGAAPLHPRERQLHPVHDPVHVDVDHPLRGRVVLLDEPAQRHDPGVVDEHVERAEPLLDLVEKALERVAPGDVELERDRLAAELRGRLLRELAVEVADRDLRALAHQCPRGRLPDPAGPAGDRDDLAPQRTRLACHSQLSPVVCVRMSAD